MVIIRITKSLISLQIMNLASRGSRTSVSVIATQAARAGGRPAGFGAGPDGPGEGAGAGTRAWLIHTVTMAAMLLFCRNAAKPWARSSDRVDIKGTALNAIWTSSMAMAGAPRLWPWNVQHNTRPTIAINTTGASSSRVAAASAAVVARKITSGIATPWRKFGQTGRAATI